MPVDSHHAYGASVEILAGAAAGGAAATRLEVNRHVG